MADMDEDDVEEVLEEYEKLEEEEEEGSDGEDGGGEESDGSDGEGDFEADFDVQDAMGEFVDQDPSVPDTLEGCFSDIDEEEDDDPDFEEGDEGEEEEEEEDPCIGSTAATIHKLGQRGDAAIYVDFISSSTVESSEQPGPDDDSEAEVTDFIASLSRGLEVHFGESDDQEVHDAIGTVMEPTEDRLRRDPDYEITPENLYKNEERSCHGDYDLVRTFTVSREGDADRLGNRGPWTNRRFNVQDLIDHLSTLSYESEEGVLVVLGACPVK